MPAIGHVLLNALFLAPGVSGGPETYLRGLGEGLFTTFPNVRFTVVTTTSGAAALRSDGWNAHADVRALPCEDGQRLRRTVAEQALLPALARRLRPDLIHSLASVAPMAPGLPAVITLHDVTFIVRRTFGAITSAGMRTIVVRAARGADRLITSSAAAREEICRVLGLDPARFQIVAHGCGRPAVTPPRPLDVLQAECDLAGRRLILCVGAKRPHKNQEVLIRALEHLDRDLVLVLAGHPESYDADLRALAAAGDVADRVRFVDFAPDDVLEALWRLASAAGLPTLAEGFGLPLLEALARGVPVACSDIAVLREVGGDAPRYFNPADPADAARALREAMRLSSQEREAGRTHAQQFTWEAAAHGTMAAYEQALRRCT